MSIASILGPKGVIAQRWPSFESRAEQLRMADAVADALHAPHHLMVEAGSVYRPHHFKRCQRCAVKPRE